MGAPSRTTRRHPRRPPVGCPTVAAKPRGNARDIYRAAAARYMEFLRDELRKLPPIHPLHHEYSAQLADLNTKGTR